MYRNVKRTEFLFPSSRVCSVLKNVWPDMGSCPSVPERTWLSTCSLLPPGWPACWPSWRSNSLEPDLHSQGLNSQWAFDLYSPSCITFLIVSLTYCASFVYRFGLNSSVFSLIISHVQIPLSGYGGTSNIILEEQRKQTDGYVAALTDIAVGHVSKMCLCVRNTGSRSAFIKAMAFSDMQKRSVMESSVISLAPSQFVLKERTQEVQLQSLSTVQLARTHAVCLYLIYTIYSYSCGFVTFVFSGDNCAHQVHPKRTEPVSVW